MNILPDKYEYPMFPKIKKHKNIEIDVAGRFMILFIFKKNKE